MSETHPPKKPDPVFDWLELRLEHLAEEGKAPSQSADEDLLRSLERAEVCAEVLNEIWPSGQSTWNISSADSTYPARTKDRSQVLGLESLGRFQIQRLLGRGGMGNVFLAFDPVLERSVALKVPRFDLTGDRELKARFLLEARAAAKLSHPNLVEVYEAGQEGPICYIASAYCDGPDLENWLAEQASPLEPKLAAGIIAQLAEAIHCCHAVGIIHRDLKPANILLAATEEPARAESGMPFVPKITDFGLARALEESLIQTRSSLIVGTPLYMAPEQAEGRVEDVGPATDIFALGVILYELLTGRPPFAGRTTLSVLSRIQRDDPPSPSRLCPGVPRGLEAITMKCLRKRPTERYQTAAELAADLTSWQSGRPITARRFTVWDRFRTWTRQPERIRDAGIAAIAWNGVIVVSILALVINDVFGIETPISAVGTDPLMLECVGVGSLHGLFAWIGWRVIRGDLWAYWIGFVAAVVMWLAVLNAFLGGYAMFQMFENWPEAKYLVMLHLTILSTIHFVAFLVTLRAPKPE